MIGEGLGTRLDSVCAGEGGLLVACMAESQYIEESQLMDDLFAEEETQHMQDSQHMDGLFAGEESQAAGADIEGFSDDGAFTVKSDRSCNRTSLGSHGSDLEAYDSNGSEKVSCLAGRGSVIEPVAARRLRPQSRLSAMLASNPMDGREGQAPNTSGKEASLATYIQYTSCVNPICVFLVSRSSCFSCMACCWKP
jgi:hypothetical protein